MVKKDLVPKNKQSATLESGRVTLRDIADTVGVSISTASRALKGAPGISRDMRLQIQAVAEELNYAGAMPGSATVTVITDLMLGESGVSEFMQAVQRGMEQKARDLGLNLSMMMVASSGVDSFKPQEDTSGYLLLSMQREVLVDILSTQNIPAVIVNGRETLMRLDAIAPSNRTGGYLGARHLLDLGHTRILTLAYSPRPTIRDRMAGGRKAMMEAGLDADDDLVIELEAMRTDLAYMAVKQRLADNKKHNFTAIQCCNDACALGAMAALSEAGLRIPQDVSVIGFDDVPTAVLNSVPLTTLRVEMEDLGARSVARLVERIRSQDNLTTYTETAVKLVVRSSTGPAPV